MPIAPRLDASKSRTLELPADHGWIAGTPASTRFGKAVESTPNPKILRFAKSERALHWSIAGPFLVSLATGAIMVLVYNPDPFRPWHSLFSSIHHISGIALACLPMLVLLINRRDIRIHLYNIKQAWTWVYDDFKWLALMGLAALSTRFKLPEQGKFNAAEKLNFMVLMSTYPLYVATGFLMWLAPLPVLSWIMHCLMAIMATPLVLGHLYMALVNASTRPGLEGMISGHVDRQWAKHHYGRWYRKHYEAEEKATPQIVAPAGSGVVDHWTYELAPDRFIRLCDRVRRSDGTTALVRGSDPTTPPRGFVKYPHSQVASASRLILWVPGGADQLVLVRTGKWVLQRKALIAVPPPNLRVFEVNLSNARRTAISLATDLSHFRLGSAKHPNFGAVQFQRFPVA